jgi:hypothetical protein
MSITGRGQPGWKTAARFIVAALLIGSAQAAEGAPGDRDTGYGSDGVVDVGLHQLALVPVSGGRVVVSGVEADGTVVAKRLTATGAVDATFGTGGRAVLGPGSSNASLFLTADAAVGDVDSTGRIVLVDRIDGIVRRLTADGAADPAWPAGGVAVTAPMDLAVDSASRPVVATRGGVIRLAVGGGMDGTFGSGGTALVGDPESPQGVDIDAADRPVVTKQSMCGPRFPCTSSVVRLTTSGVLDGSFKKTSVSGVTQLVVAPDGTIAVGAYPARRLAADGSALATVATTNVSRFAVGGDGRLFAIGQTYPTDTSPTAAVALGPDLAADVSFGHCGYAVSRSARYLADLAVVGSRLVVAHETTVEAFQLAPGGPAVAYVPGHVVTAAGRNGAVASRGPACVPVGLRSTPNLPVVGIASTPTYKGAWEVASDGGIFTFGDAGFYGSTGAIRLNKPVVGMAPTPSGRGYWLVASDGGIFCFGDAAFYGSTGAMRLNKPVVGMARTPSGRGYWLVASDGGIFAFGDAAFHGSAGALPLVAPVTGMAATTSGDGYWLVARDGGIFTYGKAPYLGRPQPDPADGTQRLDPVVAIAADPDGSGYAVLEARTDSHPRVHTFSVDDPDIAGVFYQVPLQAVGLFIA